jgi:hypothetical protein
MEKAPIEEATIEEPPMEVPRPQQNESEVLESKNEDQPQVEDVKE